MFGFASSNLLLEVLPEVGPAPLPLCRLAKADGVGEVSRARSLWSKKKRLRDVNRHSLHLGLLVVWWCSSPAKPGLYKCE